MITVSVRSVAVVLLSVLYSILNSILILFIHKVMILNVILMRMLCFWLQCRHLNELFLKLEYVVMHKTIFVINIILHMCLQHSNTL